MGFIAHALDQEQLRAVAVEADGVAAMGAEKQLLLLGQADNGYDLVESKFVQNLDRHAELTLAAIDDQQVGQELPHRILATEYSQPFAGAIGPVFHGSTEAATQHLAHAGVVIGLAGLSDGAHLEAAVVALARRALDKDDDAAHGVTALKGGDVETLDAAGRRRQVKCDLQVGNGLGVAVGVGLPFRLERDQGGAGVLAGHVDQVFLGPALGDMKRDPGPTLAAQPLLDDDVFIQVARKQHLRRQIGSFVVELFQERSQEFAVCVLLHALQQEGFPADEPAPAHKENLDAGVSFVGSEGNNVFVFLFA